MAGTAEISDDGRYRYLLTRTPDEPTGPAGLFDTEAEQLNRTCLFVMLNPSTADALKDDQTIRQCRVYTYRASCDRLVVVNLYAFRSTDPTGLGAAIRAGVNVVGPDNDRYIAEAAAEAHTTIVAWGGRPSGLSATTHDERIATVLAMLNDPQCLGTTKYGEPRHPSRLAHNIPLHPWSPR